MLGDLDWRLRDIPSVRRVLEIAALDALGLDNSLARSKVLIGAFALATASVRRCSHPFAITTLGQSPA